MIDRIKNPELWKAAAGFVMALGLVAMIIAIPTFTVIYVIHGIDWHSEFFKLGEIAGQFKAGMEQAAGEK